MARLVRGIFPLLALLALLSPAVASGAEPASLGATLNVYEPSTVEVVSRANVPTEVTLVATGDYRLSADGFPLAPGESRRVTFAGSGEGQVIAHMGARDATGAVGAIELTAWLGHVPTERPFNVALLALSIIVAVVAFGVIGAALWRRRRGNPSLPR